MVLLIMIDGLRPDAITPDRCPALTGVMARGSYTRQARTVMPSITLPCHMSLFHSVPPERHGVTTNVWSPMARPVPGLMEVARAARQRCAFFINWEPLRNVSQPGSLTYTLFRDNVEEPGGDDVMTAAALAMLPAERPDFAFFYIGGTDVAGHAHGWMSEPYLAEVAHADSLVAALLSVLDFEQDHVLIQADHGGHGRTHGEDIPEDMTIPWMVAGPRIRRDCALNVPVSMLDTAPTLARLLGLAAHEQWEGRCVEAAFAA